MDSVLIGYFPKRVVMTPDWLRASGVTEICSVSTCLSHAPEDWIDHWLHNDVGVFSTIVTARRVLSAGAPVAAFQIHAYRLFPTQFDEGVQSPYSIPPLDVQELPRDYISLGFDAVARSSDLAFDCSPLSCNDGALEFPVNRFCLLDDEARAFDLARTFSAGRWEPGPYFVVEVLRAGTA